jgi:hypothetical protein
LINEHLEHENSITPMNVDELEKRALISEKQYQSGNITKQKELENESKEW